MKTIAFTRFFFLIVLLFLQVSCGEGDDNNGGQNLYLHRKKSTMPFQ